MYVESKHPLNIEEIIHEVRYYSKIFIKLALGKEEDKEILSAIEDINDLKVEVSYPFIIEVLDDYSREMISRKVTLSILRMVESYVLRRAICDIPTNSLNKTFATLLRNISKTNYIENIRAEFLLIENYKRFPSDEEFRNQFPVISIYNSNWHLVCSIFLKLRFKSFPLLADLVCVVASSLIRISGLLSFPIVNQ